MHKATLVAALIMIGVGVHAEDYYLKSNYGTLSGAVWQSAEDSGASPVSPTAGNTYWIVNGLYGKLPDSYEYAMPGTLCIGAANSADWISSKSGSLQKGSWFNAGLRASAIWYNGTIRIDCRYEAKMFGTLNVVGSGSGISHKFTFQDACSNVSGLQLQSTVTSDSEDVNVDVSYVGTPALTLDQAKNGQMRFLTMGDNSGYKGTWKISSAYAAFRFSGSHALGDPSVPNAAALQVCDKGFVGLDAANPLQSRNRGIRLDGDVAYLMSFTSGGSTLEYSVSRNDGAAGRLIKVGSANKVTLDGIYSAGVIEVSEGTLALGANAVLTKGQEIVVRDGATLEVSYGPGIGKLNVAAEGTGKVVYPEGYRQDEDGNWEVRVRASVVGDGTVDPAEQWVKPGAKVTFVATDGAASFRQWTGDVEAAGLGVDVFAKRLTVDVSEVAPTLVANFGLPAKPADVVNADGTTYAFADRVLTITVPTGVTHPGNYGSSVTDGYVTNIVKRGAGTLQLAAASAYCGFFEFAEGKASAGTAGAFGANGCGGFSLGGNATLTIASSATLATGKRIGLAGTVNNTVANISGFVKNCAIRLTGDVTWSWAADKQDSLPPGSTFDLAGHQLNLSPAGSWCTMVLTDVVFTNSDETVACTITTPHDGYLHIYGKTGFFGGSRNKLIFGWDSDLTIATVIEGDWTLNVNTVCQILTKANQTGNNLDCQWKGTLSASGTETAYNGIRYNDTTDGCLTFAGPVSGGGLMPIQGGIVNFLSSENTFSGKVSLLDTRSSKLRSQICVWDGAAFSAGEAKPVEISNGDFWMGSNTAFRLPSFTQLTGMCRFSGGPSADKACGRATLVNFTKAGGTTLTIDSPVVLSGKTDIQVGTLALSSQKLADEELPVFSNLVFAADTGFDMHGNDLTVPNMTGFPIVSNAGKLTLEGTWTVDYADILAGKALDLGAGKLSFAPGAKIIVRNRTSEASAEPIVLARATGGIAGLPTLEGLRRSVSVSGSELQLRRCGLFLIVK